MYDVRTEEREEGIKKYPNFANKHYIHLFCGQGEGSNKSKKFVDVIYGSPLAPVIVSAFS